MNLAVRVSSFKITITARLCIKKIPFSRIYDMRIPVRLFIQPTLRNNFSQMESYKNGVLLTCSLNNLRTYEILILNQAVPGSP